MKRWIALFFFVFAFWGCGSKSASKPSGYLIGRDTSWFPLQFGEQAIAINGFTNKLVQEIGKKEEITMNIVDIDWLQLFYSLDEEEVEGIFTSIPPTVESQAVYSFSEPFLLLGPVLVVPIESKASSLEDLSGKIVGVNQFDDSVLVVQKYPSIVIELYQNIPMALEALSQGAYDGLLIPNLDAHTLVPHLYRNQLKIVTLPLNNKALRLITLKDEHKKLIESFNKGLKELFESSQYKETLEQFGLPRVNSIS
ncbi:MAG: transporter substrate-binding domain-containing protein [Chlamydiales bacterium]